MASQWGSHSLAPGSSAGWYFIGNAVYGQVTSPTQGGSGVFDVESGGSRGLYRDLQA